MDTLRDGEDCGDHYILARYASYDKIDKSTLAITKDIEDR